MSTSSPTKQRKNKNRLRRGGGGSGGGGGESMTSSTSKSSSRQRRHVVQIELPNHMKAPEPSTLPPFVLGFLVAMVLIFVPTISGVYWVCKDKSSSFRDNLEEEPFSCPRVLKKQQEKSRGWKRFFQKRKEEDKNALLVEVKSRSVPGNEKKPVCACEIIWNLLGRSNKMSQSSSNDQTTYCTPEIIVEEQLKSNNKQAANASSSTVSNNKKSKGHEESYKTAFTSERLQLDPLQKQLIQQLATRTKDYIDDWEERFKNIKWGGAATGWDWFDGEVTHSPKGGTTTDLEKLDGGHLLYSYLRIMKWPTNLHSHFPFKHCAKGCNSEESIRHTLEYREKYKPWLVSKSAIRENTNGNIYVHGFSPPLDLPNENGSHSLVWIRPGNRIKVDNTANIRAHVHTLERAVQASLERSHGRVGKFNVVVDGHGFSWGLLPSIHDIKSFVTMLQDHFPDRLGIVLLTNLGRFGEFVVSLFMPLITEEVRNKIIVLPHDPEHRQEVLETVVGVDNIPTWLGGTDTYEFNADQYYSDSTFIVSDEEANEYLITMPYHK